MQYFFFVSGMACEGLAGNCLGNVSYTPCNDTVFRVDQHQSGWGLVRHLGTHDHPWPEAKKPDRLSQAEFAKEVQKNPKAGAFKLKVFYFSNCFVF
jgi:hypothetical protein